MRLCVIAARSGSKGLPGKNIRHFAGRPLLAHTVAQARASGCFDVVALSSDSARYREIGAEAGATLLIERPDTLAGDDVAKAPVLHHALQVAERQLGAKVELLVDLQPTSPLRRAGDIPGAVALLEQDDTLLNVVSVSPTRASPYFTLAEQRPDGTLSPCKERPVRATRRQDLPLVYQLNGSIYAWRRDAIVRELPALTERTGCWLMPEECAFDIDSALEFELAAFVAERHFGWARTVHDG